MKKLLLLTLIAGFSLFQGCATHYISQQETTARVMGYDTNYTDVLSVHCRAPMVLIVSFQRANYECEPGEVLSLTYKFSLVYSSRGSNSSRVPVLMYPKDPEYSEVEGITGTWYVQRNRSSDESWLIELTRQNRLAKKIAR